jgi:ABC-2 type transport system permease protein
MKYITTYPAAYFVWSMEKIVRWAVEFVMIYIMLYQFKAIAGWSADEVMLLYALNVGSYSLAGLFFLSISEYLPKEIQSGEFDEVLTRPVNSFLYLMFRDFRIGLFGNILVAVTVLTFCFVRLHITFTFLKFLFFLLVLFGAILIQGALMVAVAIPSFWVVQSKNIHDTFVSIRNFVRYPLSIYDVWLQILLTVVLPFGFVNFYPAQYFLQKHDFLIFHPVFQFLTPVIGVILFVLAYQYWKFGVNHYQGTGT